MIATPRLKQHNLLQLHRLVTLLAAAVVSTQFTSTHLCADSVTSNWNGGTGNWNSTNWSNGAAPNNGGGNTYLVQIDGGNAASNSTVTLGSSVAISGLMIDVADSLLLNGNTTLTFAGGGGIAINGGLAMTSGSTEAVAINAATTLAGTGTLTMGSSNRIYATDGASRLTVGSGFAVQGNGSIDTLALTNGGTINANVSGKTLTITPAASSTVINTGTIEATGGGAVSYGGAMTNTGGTILANGAGSQVKLTAGMITGGNISTTNGGLVAWTSGSSASTCGFNGVAFSGTMNINGPSNGGYTLIGITGGSLAGTINQTANAVVYLAGTINQNAAWMGSASSMWIAQDTVLSGTGSVTLVSDSNYTVYLSGSTSAIHLTIGAGQTIQGGGSISSLIFTNTGTINATSTTNPLTISVSSGSSLMNTGTLKATAGGTLAFSSSPVDNTAGSILVSGAGSVLSVGNSIITGGSITCTSGGSIDWPTGLAASTGLNNVTVSGPMTIRGISMNITGGSLAGTITQNYTSTVTLAGSITQNAVWSLSASSGHFAVVTIGSNATLSGTGNFVLSSDSLVNATINGTNNPTLTLGSGQTVQGTGTINTLVLANGGVINANVSGKTLALTPYPGATSVNTGTLEATGGGILTMSSPNFTAPNLDNSAGTILADGAGSQVMLNNAKITGGAITTSNGGSFIPFTAGANTSGLKNVTFSGTMNAANASSNGASVSITDSSITGTINQSGNSTIILNGNITLNAAWTLTTSSWTPYLTVGSNMTLSGLGSITLAGGTISGANYPTFTLGAGQAIQGSGTITGLALVNATVINANVATRTLTLSLTSGTVSLNTGTLEATNGGSLSLSSGAVVNTGGNILADGAGSQLVMGDCLVTGGTMRASNGAVVNWTTGSGSSAAGLNNVAFSGTLNISGSANLGITGGSLTGAINQSGSTAVSVSGTLTLNLPWMLTSASGSLPYLFLSAPVLLTGSGSVTLGGTGTAGIHGSSNPLTIDGTQTVQGAGAIGTVLLTNTGVINANASGKALAITLLSSSASTNAGTLKATNGGIMDLSGGPLTNTAGTILVDGAGSQLKLANGMITGGTVTATNGGVVTWYAGTTAATSGFNNVALSGTMNVVPSSTLNIGLSNSTFNGTIYQGGNCTVTLGPANTVNAAWTLDQLSTLSIGTGATLAGSGSLTVTNGSLAGSGAGASLTVGSGFTVQGYGTLGSTGSRILLTNNGLIWGNSSLGFLNAYLSSGTNVNTGILKATGTGTLSISGSNSTLDNTGGTILADGASARMWVGGLNIIGGTLATANSGQVSVYTGTLTNITSTGNLLIPQTGNPTISGGTFSGPIVQWDGTSVTLVGTITMNSTWTMYHDMGKGTFNINSDVTLTGRGSLTTYGNIQTTAGTPPRLTLDTSFTLHGGGYDSSNIATISGIAITNRGTIDGAYYYGLRIVSTAAAPVTNLGTLQASSYGRLYLNGPIDNTGGTIFADATSVVTIGSATITGGNITSAGNGNVCVANQTPMAFNNVTFSGKLNVVYDGGFMGLTPVAPMVINGGSLAGTITQNSGSLMTLNGAVSCSAAWNVPSSGSISIGSDTTLSGTGTINLSFSPTIYADDGASRLTIGPGFTIKGSGSIGSTKRIALTNNGTISTNNSFLNINPAGTFFNNGLITSVNESGSGVIAITGTAPGHLLDNTLGTISANGSGTGVIFNNILVSGGTLSLANGGSF